MLFGLVEMTYFHGFFRTIDGVLDANFSLNAFGNLPEIITILNRPPTGKPLYGVEHSNGGLITFPGGVPIKVFLSQNDRDKFSCPTNAFFSTFAYLFFLISMFTLTLFVPRILKEN